MLVRVSYLGKLTGMAGRSTLSIAQIVGVSDINNRRDRIRSAMLFHDGWVAQVIEGERLDVDRLIRRLRADPRLTDIRILSDTPIAARVLTEPASFCHEAVDTLTKVGLDDLSHLTLNDIDAMLEYRQAA